MRIVRRLKLQSAILHLQPFDGEIVFTLVAWTIGHSMNLARFLYAESESDCEDQQLYPRDPTYISSRITPSKMAALSKQLDRRTKIPSQLNVRMTKDILAGSRRQLLLSFRLPFLFISFRILPSPSPTSHLCNNLLSREVLQMAADHSAAILAYLSVSSVVSCITIIICISTST